jgi:hypothetical protein
MFLDRAPIVDLAWATHVPCHTAQAGITSSGVTVTLKAQELEMWDKYQDRYVVEPGNYTIMVGQFCTDPHMARATITVTA